MEKKTNRQKVDEAFYLKSLELYTEPHSEARCKRWVLHDFRPRKWWQKLSPEQCMYRDYMRYWGDFSTSSCKVRDAGYASGRCLIEIYQKPNSDSRAYRDGEQPCIYPQAIYVDRDAVQDFLNFCGFMPENVSYQNW